MNPLSPKFTDFLVAVTTYLQTQGLGTIGSNLFYSQLPSKPVKCIGIMLQPGLFREGEPLTRLETQVLVRDESYVSGLSRAQTIYEHFHHAVPLLPTIRARVVPLSAPGTMYRDDNGFFVFSTNYAWVLTPV